MSEKWRRRLMNIRRLVSHSCEEQIHDRGRAVMRDERGMAGVEFAVVMGTLCFLLFNGVEVARYAWIRMQVENAAQAGAQAAWKTCDPSKLPVVVPNKTPEVWNCPELVDEVTDAIKGTSLNGSVEFAGWSEGYYCANASDELQSVGTLDSPPKNCTGTGRPELIPGDYIQIDVKYTYDPLFADLTVIRFFSRSIEKTARMRVQ